jgi:hypothetical protein
MIPLLLAVAMMPLRWSSAATPQEIEAKAAAFNAKYPGTLGAVLADINKSTIKRTIQTWLPHLAVVLGLLCDDKFRNATLWELGGVLLFITWVIVSYWRIEGENAFVIEPLVSGKLAATFSAARLLALGGIVADLAIGTIKGWPDISKTGLAVLGLSP